jgi:asparagine synthase (glutamine-hydrolysing)
MRGRGRVIVAVSDLDNLRSWFVALPECDAAAEAAAPLRVAAETEVAHASGRPLIVGDFPPDALTTGAAGDTVVALIGQHALTGDQLDEEAARIRTVSDVDRLARSVVGSSHLIASVGGRVRLQGTVTGVRRIFHARLGGVTVAADRADVLAGLLGAGVDDQCLALHLLEPPILYPLAGRPVWHGVESLATDHYLVIDEHGRERSTRWWSPPDPVVPMAEGAPALREALSAAVEARTQGRDLVSCDLGGLDSTAVCCLAARGQVPVVAYTVECWDPEADDAHWAALTVARLRNLEHHLIPAEEVPLSYDGVFDMEDPLDEPHGAAVDRNRSLVNVRRAAGRGSSMHLTGFGGDELLYGSLAHLHSLVRTKPRVAMRHLRGFASKYRWSRRETLRQLSDRSPYRLWLARIAERLSAPPEPIEQPLLDWGFEPRLPPWATPAAFEAVRDLIRAEARAVEPLARRRGEHRELETMRFVSRIARHCEQAAARMGVGFAAPYYDDRVIEAGLAVRPEERITPWRYKPLIIEAMRGIVPEQTLARQTKANASYEEEAGLREHRGDLVAACDESRLAELGLIDADALRDVISRPLPPELQGFALHQTLACEAWLRAVEGAPTQARREPDAQVV